MKRNILNGILLMGALALGSCSTTKLASNQAKQDDDVYFSNAKAGDAPVYVASTQDYNAPNYNNQTRYNNYNDDDYYYYDSYASRINRFGYYSPFTYYDDIYTGYSPYYGYSSPYYSPYYGGFSLGFGYGIYGSPYYGYNPYGYGYGYSPYSFYGTGYGYGGGWGIYSAYNTRTETPRPYRGSGAPNNAMVSRNVNGIGYSGNYPVNASYPGRPNSTWQSNGRQAVNSVGNNNNNVNNRPIRGNTQQIYTPQPQVQSAPPPSSNSGGSSSSGGGAVSSGGGSSRPVRP